MSWTIAPLDIKKRILAHLYLDDVQRLAGSNSEHRNLCQKELHHRIAFYISKFELEPATFLSALKRWDAIVGGSAAVAIFTAGEVEPRDLNIYVPYGNLSDFARDATSKPNSPTYPWTVSTAKTDSRKPRVAITISESLSKEATIPVMLSPSTITMNYFSHTTFVSAYPQLLGHLLAIGNSLPQHASYPDTVWASRYLLAGFRILGTRSISGLDGRHKCLESVHCTRTRRVLGDRGTLVMSFSEDSTNHACFEGASVSWRLATVRACQWKPPRYGRLSARVTPKLKPIAWDGNGTYFPPKSSFDEDNPR
ncbi:hypothetical protein BKA70DRAFT_1447522 [Coprinopsis sp. MPI-PUGE-AT-0042]|nr:hypothetical protein BKA70DRAFT_1447522 [Coprinopsis sp. MPI-PUGE-AT-0042]